MVGVARSVWRGAGAVTSSDGETFKAAAIITLALVVLTLGLYVLATFEAAPLRDECVGCCIEEPAAWPTREREEHLL